MVETAIVKFHPGQIVRHKQHRYRGVIFDVDLDCLAGEAFFYADEVVERGQPWYHLLVDGADVVTYVAESNLEADVSHRPVKHPLVGVIFGDYRDGRYFRGLDA